MLTEEEQREIQDELSHYPRKRAGGVEALKIVQRRRGWVSDDALQAVADVVGMAPAELDRLATFYPFIFRKPVGRHVVLVCDSVACWLMGADRVASGLQDRLRIGFGETTEDGRVTLLPTVCLGACDRAPAVLMDESLRGGVAEADLDGIVEEAT